MEMLNKIKNPLNKYVELPGADHSSIALDLENNTKYTKISIDYFDSLIQRKENMS
jgi:hypothetical protein